MRPFRHNNAVIGTKGRHLRLPRRWSYRAFIVAGVLLVAGVATWQIYATVWSTHSQRAGQALVHKFLKNRALSAPVNAPGAATGTSALTSCASSTQSSDPVKGLLEIPKLGVTAPVEEGIDDAQLAVAVGHDPYSVWPGASGNSVLEAHDVSYFVGLAHLSAGDTVRYVAPCTTYVFRVSGSSIVSQGSPVYDTATPTITLVTCWPTNALWFTPDRFLVFGDEVSQSSTTGGTQYLATSPPPTVPVPAELASQGVTLTTYSLPMGTFTLGGSPDPAWAQTTNPLLVENAGVEAYIAGVRALVEDRLDWWGKVAPGVGAPGPLVGAQNPGYLTPLNVTVSATGARATTVTLTNTVVVKGGSAPGRYSVTVAETIHGGTLVVSGWTMQPA